MEEIVLSHSSEENIKEELNIDINIIPRWKQKLIEFIKIKVQSGTKLTFIHTPKCAGTYAAKYLELCKINNKQHHRANKRDGFTFTIIRDPVERYESLLNYRLSRQKLGKDWPKRMRHVLHNESITLDQIVEGMRKREIKNFTPYYSLKYWTKGVHLMLTINEFLPFLKMLGYEITENFARENVSKKMRGKITGKNVDKIKSIYQQDYDIYNFWTRKDMDNELKKDEIKDIELKEE